MESKGTNAFMGDMLSKGHEMRKSKLPKPSNENKEVHVEVDSWQWETKPSRFTWKQWLVLALLISVALLFAFGFLIVAAVVLAIGLIINIILYFLKKLS